MNDLNSLLVEGRLTRDPELKYTQSGTALCKFSIAVNRYRPSDGGFDKEVSFFDVTSWGKQAELCGEHLRKGRGVRVSGRIKQERWESNGDKRSKVGIQADRVEFKSQRQDGGGYGDTAPEPTPEPEPKTNVIPFEDDIPF